MLESWLDQGEPPVSFHEYWDDEEREKSKPWFITSPTSDIVLHHIERMGYVKDVACVRQKLLEWKKVSDKVLDLGAGTCWLSALLSQWPEVESIEAMDASRHRIGRLSEITITSLGGVAKKIRRIHASFYDIRRPKQSYGIVFMAASFHHADQIVRLLVEIDKVLKPGGTVVLLGERPVTLARACKRFLGNLIKKRKITLYFPSMFTADPTLGDHYFRKSHYELFFRGLGYDFRVDKSPSGNFIIFAFKP